MPAKIEIDESRWPKVRITWPSTVVDDAEFERVIDRISALTARREHYVIIHDARHAVRATPKQRAYAAAAQEKTADDAAHYLVGSAIVVSNPLVAGVVRAINWIAPPTYPQRIFSSLEDAEVWCNERLH